MFRIVLQYSTYRGTCGSLQQYRVCRANPIDRMKGVRFFPTVFYSSTVGSSSTVLCHYQHTHTHTHFTYKCTHALNIYTYTIYTQHIHTYIHTKIIIRFTPVPHPTDHTHTHTLYTAVHDIPGDVYVYICAYMCVSISYIMLTTDAAATSSPRARI